MRGGGNTLRWINAAFHDDGAAGLIAKSMDGVDTATRWRRSQMSTGASTSPADRYRVNPPPTAEYSWSTGASNSPE